MELQTQEYQVSEYISLLLYCLTFFYRKTTIFFLNFVLSKLERKQYLFFPSLVHFRAEPSFDLLHQAVQFTVHIQPI